MLLTPEAASWGTADYTGSHAVGAVTLRDWIERMIGDDPTWDTQIE
jgi:hypothetical protein